MTTEDRMDGSGSTPRDKAGEVIGDDETTPDRPRRSLAGEWAAFARSHRFLLVWPVFVFLVALGVIVSLVAGAPAAPFIYSR